MYFAVRYHSPYNILSNRGNREKHEIMNFKMEKEQSRRRLLFSYDLFYAVVIHMPDAYRVGPAAIISAGIAPENL